MARADRLRAEREEAVRRLVEIGVEIAVAISTGGPSGSPA
jgi:hypothetical protein